MLEVAKASRESILKKKTKGGNTLMDRLEKTEKGVQDIVQTNKKVRRVAMAMLSRLQWEKHARSRLCRVQSLKKMKMDNLEFVLHFSPAIVYALPPPWGGGVSSRRKS